MCCTYIQVHTHNEQTKKFMFVPQFGVSPSVRISRAAAWEVLENRWSKQKNRFFVKLSLG